ncbi:hypothetical protein [Sphingomonas sp.]|uniref:hypothetical protein n=1 Tax=Sphingomonas sp. TaxID=28214 RepID=UPI002CF1B5EF|nr:hypothetical protein [Sphingomonas sp.]HTG37195.1 hypothetical protein [Sphingomonas sp.]
MIDPLLFLQLALAPDVAWLAQADRTAQAGARAQVRIERRIVIRVPRMTAAPGIITTASAAPLPPISWVERRGGDQCVPVTSLAAASVTRPDAVDLVLSGGRRMRARLGEDCPALNFQSGFYLRPPADGQICARRDLIRSRSGGECRIETFRALVPSR